MRESLKKKKNIILHGVTAFFNRIADQVITNLLLTPYNRYIYQVHQVNIIMTLKTALLDNIDLVTFFFGPVGPRRAPLGIYL